MLRLDVPQAPESTIGSSPVLGFPGKMLPWVALHILGDSGHRTLSFSQVSFLQQPC